jgi:hypothetical protein
MSESAVTAGVTGIVPSPLSLCATAVSACINAAKMAAEYGARQYDQLHRQLESEMEKLKWVDQQLASSPKQLEQELVSLHAEIKSKPAFIVMTGKLKESEKNNLASAIVTEKSVVNQFAAPLLNKRGTSMSIEKVAKVSTRRLAEHNLLNLQHLIKSAALKTGFSNKEKIIEQTASGSEGYFEDEKGRRFSVVTKLDKLLRPKMIFDLEGFGCGTNECTLKMSEILSYLKEKGVSVDVSRYKHNQPSGIIGNLLKEKKKEQENLKRLNEYLKGNGSSGNNYLTTKTDI